MLGGELTGYLDNTAVEVRYLLGELSGEEEKSFENRYFANDQAFEELQIAEGEVIDAYVSETLPAPARKHFEQRLEKSPRLRARVAFARTFAGAIPDIQLEELPVAPAKLRPPKINPPVIPLTVATVPRWNEFFKDLFARQPALTLALAACVVLVLLGGGAVVVQSVRLRHESQRLADERAAIARQREELNRIAAEQNSRIEEKASENKAQERRNTEELARIEARLQKTKETEGSNQQKIATPTMAAVFLSAGSLRGEGGPAEVKIPPGVSHLPLRLGLETADYRKYNVLIKDGQQKEVFEKNGLSLRPGKILFFKVPTTKLTAGVYSVDVSGVAASGAEHVRILRFRVVSD
jgi:anti-sigma factor RsiW